MNIVGTISSLRQADLKRVVSVHTTTEHIFAFIDRRELTYEIHNMDEYTIDIVVFLDEDVCLVYDTT